MRQWMLGFALASSVSFGATICSITTTGCSDGEATCTAAGTPPSSAYYAGGGSVTSWDTGTCVKEEKYLRCTKTTSSIDSKVPDKVTTGWASSEFACCDEKGKAFATAVEADAKKNCAHP